MYDGGRALPQCCFNDGPHFQRSGDVETVLFQCITLITFGILHQTSPNFQGSRRNGCEWCVIITLSIQATCLVSSNCSVTHVRWGEGTSSVLFQWRPAFSALWRRGNSVVSVHHINNFWNTWSNLTKFSGQSPQWLRMVCGQLHVKRLRINWDIIEKRSADVVTTLAQCFALITFEVLNQTPPNLLGSCRSSSRWYLQNYMKNGWELTSELTSKWIYILKYSSKFHTNLINNFWSTRSNSTEFTGQWP